MSYYQVGLTLNPYAVATKLDEMYQKQKAKVKKTIREEAAKGAAPAAKKSVTPLVVGAVALSALSLIVALRK